MPGELHIDRPAEGVLRLAIRNPSKHGALDHAILDGLSRALRELDDDVRAVVLTGSGDHFSSGYDIGDIPDDVFAVEAQRLVAHPFTGALEALDDCAVPTLAALTGHAIGGGLELALTCDLRIAAAGVKLGMPPAKLGLVYSHTGLRRFIEAIGVARTRELFLLGRNVDAAVAERWALVNAVVSPADLQDEALDWAQELAANAPLSQRGNKRVIRALLDAAWTLDPRLEAELLALREASFESEDMREGIRAFGEKRAARWRGR